MFRSLLSFIACVICWERRERGGGRGKEGEGRGEGKGGRGGGDKARTN